MGSNCVDYIKHALRFEFVINLQTAKALGLDTPNSIQLLADQVIGRMDRAIRAIGVNNMRF